MKKVKIVCTIGPACSTFEMLCSMAEEGMNVARFNFSHGSYEEHKARLDLVREVERKMGSPIATLLDTKGPEIRTGTLQEGAVFLKKGQDFVLTTRDVVGNDKEVFVNYANLPIESSVDQDIYIDDGTLHLKVTEISENDVHCTVIVGGELGERKGVNIPGASISLPALSEKDRSDICWGLKNDMEYIAVSFVKNQKDIMDVRKVIEEAGGTMKIIAKIETRQAVDGIDEILDVVDGVMIARGDLGVEIPTEEVPLVQKEIIDLCRSKGKAVIVATQMLDSMIRNPRPTRAEASDVANAVLDGADAVMLSGETAKGTYPLRSVETMRRIVERVEKDIELWQHPLHRKQLSTGVPDAVSGASVEVAREMGAAAIISLTRSGSTAQMISKHRPPCKIIGATPVLRTWRELALYWGVEPLRVENISNQEQAIDNVFSLCLENKLLKEGDIVVVTAGVPMGIPGTTNMLQVHTVGRILVKGLSLLKKEAFGVVKKANTPEEALEKMERGNILVVSQTDKDFVPAMRKAAAIITEHGGLTCHAAIVALELGIPCVVSASNALSVLEDGMMVTVDGFRGVVYAGSVRLRA
ncbi:MAG: pyruvate kinase [Aminobacterium sp.]|jgi:pyruvate kinase|uniref:pyruvate kinase n=1 Tax=unclassified Aminobacterium TaxID=2685012 RepID=UPI001BCD68F1|nr:MULTISPECIES: pyruvate kinase [unclassified Aminobacterium]MDD2206548.1 pyruvate kinase [Aminobacterium sp.]MDD3427031.1 pyruvate kinase [Aminobacterium sp.]MDD3707344.1 pyruvate kinase [Aminobacterium sp.]MDD4228467.1 pyruvate kinase [Aminobacterium sp.]MDD4551390.1 pyruvate kinase [Aminobacterium sp.]